MLCFWLTNNCLERVGKAQAKPRNPKDIKQDIGKGEVFGFVFHFVWLCWRSPKGSPIPSPGGKGNGQRLVGRVFQSQEAEGDPGIPQLILQTAAGAIQGNRNPRSVPAAGFEALVGRVPLAWMHGAVFRQDPPDPANIEGPAAERDGNIAVARQDLSMSIHRIYLCFIVTRTG